MRLRSRKGLTSQLRIRKVCRPASLRQVTSERVSSEVMIKARRRRELVQAHCVRFDKSAPTQTPGYAGRRVVEIQPENMLCPVNGA